MHELIYERIAEAGFLKAGHIQTEKIACATMDKLFNLVQEINTITSVENIQRENIPFAHFASTTLSGHRHPCDFIGCRMERIHELMQFAVLYSDRVYVRNILADPGIEIIHEMVNGRISENEEVFRKHLMDDLIILNEMRPVIEKGYIIPFTPPLHTCPHCLAKQSFGRDGEARLVAMEDYINQRYCEEVSVSLSMEGDEFIFDFSGPESLVDHGRGTFVFSRMSDGSISPRLMPISSLIKRAERGEKVQLTKTAQRKIKLVEGLAEAEIQSICIDLFAAQSFGTSFLTNRPVHIEALDILSADNELERRNSIAREHLTSILPFISDVPTDDLISIREAEGDAFILYRQALNQAINEYRSSSSDFSEKDARMLYADVIAPQITALDQKVKSTRRRLTKRTGITIAAWAGAITFGVYSGFVPPDLIKAAQTLGLTHVVVDLIRSAAVGLDTTEKIRSDDLYFLWKVKKKQRQ